jgi:hypothetical protein
LERGVLAPHALGKLAADLRSLIEAARLRVAQTVNAELVPLYWQIGNQVRRDTLGQAGAEFGDQIVSTLSIQLTAEYGSGFSRPNLFHMFRLVEAWPDQAQVTALGTQPWPEPLQGDSLPRKRVGTSVLREMCRLERRSVRSLRDRPEHDVRADCHLAFAGNHNSPESPAAS